MNRILTASTLLTGLLLGACASAPQAPAELVEARSTLRSAALDAGVLTHAPLELQKATASLNRANALQDQGKSLAEINSAAYVASQQAKTAIAIAKAKTHDLAIASAEVDRERTRADVLASKAERAQADSQTAQAQSSLARQQTSDAEQRTRAAQAQAATAQGLAAAAQASATSAQQQAELLKQQLTALQATQTERGMLVTLGDVLFEFNRAEVKPGAQVSLRKLSDFLQQNPTRQILIEGHTDSIGSAASNNLLSRRRADAVDAALVGMGMAARRATAVGYGEDYPIADNATDTNRALNRRVEVYIAENEQPVKQRR